MSFWKELSRRNVVKVGVAYAVAAWLIIHPVDIIFPILHLPEWSITLIAAILIILFPLVLIFSWVYEVTPKGLKKTKEVPASKSITQHTGKRLNYIIVGLLVVAVAYLLFDKYFIGRGAIETKQIPASNDQAKAKDKKSIAILPFTDLSPAKDQEYFASGLSEEMINSITQIPDLRVIARTSSFAFKNSDRTAQEIGKALNVEYILEGSVRKAGNELRITAQLIRTSDESHLWSKPYDKELKDIFTIQEDIATAVASELKTTLGIGKSLKQVGGTDNPEAYELYLVARGQYTDKTELALKSVEAALELDPKFALAWEFKSECHNNLSFQASPELVASVRDAGLRAAQKAIELEPNLASGYVSLAFSQSVSGNFIEAGLTYRKAFEMATYESADPNRCSITHYLAMGYIKKIKYILEEAWKNDPFNKDIRGWHITILAYLDEIQRAEKEYERGKAMFLNDWLVGDIFIYQARIATGNLKSSDTTMSWETTNVAKKHLDSPKDGLADLHRLYNEKNNLDTSTLQEYSLWAAYFGDTDFALDTIAQASKYNAEVIGCLWLPVYKEVRQTPRFKALVKKIGLVDYWNKFGWPDMCHKLDNGDFVCD
jgi:adenylate cyclase